MVTAEERSRLLATLHHVVGDGWSLGILAREVGQLYAARLDGGSAELAPLPIRYGDFARHQRSRLDGGELDGDLAWWRDRLDGAPELLDLPTDRPRPRVASLRGGVERRFLSERLRTELEALAAREHRTPFMVALAAAAVVLGRLSARHDLVLGSPVAGRDRVETEGLVGLFVNTLPLRVRLTGAGGGPSFSELLDQVAATTLGAHARQELPFERLVEELVPHRGLAHAPLVQVLFAFDLLPDLEVELPGLEVRPLGLYGGTAKVDFSLDLRRSGSGLSASGEYRRDLFDATTIARWLGHFETLLEAALADPEAPVDALPLLAPAELAQIVAWEEGRDERTPPIESDSVELGIARRAALQPDAVALEGAGVSWTYRHLMARAAGVSSALAARGIGAEARVGVVAERRGHTLAAVLGTLGAGAAYVPLEPSLPERRLEALAADAGLSAVLCLGPAPPWLARTGIPALSLEALATAETPESPHQPAADASAYVLFTSGTSGRPKGVVVPRSALAAQCADVVTGYGLGADDRMLQFASLAFDTSVEEIFPTLLAGATLVLTEERPAEEARVFFERSRRHAVTVLDLPTAYWHQLVDELAEGGAELPETVRLVILGGEAALPDALVAWQRSTPAEARLVNTYGPTEATVVALRWWAERAEADSHRPSGSSLPLGRPLSYASASVLDPTGLRQPPGAPGELHLAGAGLARGYLGRPGRTALAFRPDPRPDATPGGRLYATGDRARWRPDGVLEFLGRLDEQVKVRGYRVEPGEVEATLAGLTGVRAAAVSVETGAGGPRLIAHVASDRTAPELRAALAAELPSYMLPSALVVLEALPLGPTGKVDRTVLPPAGAEPAGGEAPRGPVEEALAGFWRDLLEVDEVGRLDDFFALGGHSLLATRVASRARRAFGVELPLADLFEASELAVLAARIEGALGSRDSAGERPLAAALPLTAVERDGSPPLSFAQRRLWFLDRLEPESAAYHVPEALRLDGPLDVARLAGAFDRVVARHEVLRTRFVAVADEPLQIVAPARPVALPVVDLSALPRRERGETAKGLVAREARKRFDLSLGPLLRVLLVRLGAEEHALAMTLHHIVSDGWSSAIFVRELAAFYTGPEAGAELPPELELQYADYALWQHRAFEAGLLEAQIEHWSTALAGAPELHTLPTDRPRPALQTFRGAAVSTALRPEVAGRIEALGRRHGATPFMVYLAAFFALLARLGGGRDLVVGAPIAGRRHVELEPLIGFFVNTLVLRGDASGRPSLRELVDRVRDRALAAYAHQDLPFERLVEEVAPERQLGAHPLFQILFVLQNAAAAELAVPGVTLSPLEVHTGTSKFDLALFLAPRADGGLEMALEYATDLFDTTTVRRWLRLLSTLVSAAAEEPERALAELPWLPPPERHQVLFEDGVAAPREASVRLDTLLADSAAGASDRIAVAEGAMAWTYGELARRAAGVSAALQARGLGGGDRVGILLAPGAEQIAALWGTLAAGAAYVPLDPELPATRMSLLLEDCGASLLLVAADTELALPAGGPETLAIEDIPAASADARAALPFDSVDAPAYVIYTSGSTGRPKGVEVAHASLTRFLHAMIERPGLDREDRLLALTTVSFDIAALELFGPLLVGARVEIAGSRVGADGRRLGRLLAERAVTVLQATPSTWRLLLESGWHAGGETGHSGLVALSGGEALPPALADRLAPRVAELWNLYGPTETTIWSSVARLERRSAGDRVAIGRAITGTELYVAGLDGDELEREPLPSGAVGELVIGGEGVAVGYSHRPARTAAAFVPDAWSGRRGARLYRTGDRARRLPDGRFEVLGRLDHQVKVRGNRIELGEIEAALESHEAVARAAAAVFEESPGEHRLAAYVVADAAFRDPAGQREAWTEVWDRTYRQADEVRDAAFDLAGWVSSLTGEALADEEMAEWVDHTVARILEPRPKRVLELGCGTGLLLFRVAPEVERYVATDVSESVVESVTEEVARRGLGGVELHRLAADELPLLVEDEFDLVILNSVVQYFPDAAYLEDVLRQAARRLAPGGALFIGDVRGRSGLEAFHASVALARAEDEVPAAELAARARSAVADERELCLDEAFFTGLVERSESLAGARFLAKRGRHANELTRFRYDVVLETAPAPPAGEGRPLERIEEVPFDDAVTAEGEVDLAVLSQRIEAAVAEGRGVRLIGWPNARLAGETELLAALSSEEPGELGSDLRRRWTDASGGVDPEALCRLAEALGTGFAAQRSASAGFAHLDAAFWPSGEGSVAAPDGRGLMPRFEGAEPDAASNRPKEAASGRLAALLRQHLAETLPAAMLPSSFVVLDALPLTPNGKVDRRALPAPGRGDGAARTPFRAPETALERRVATVWSEVLGLTEVGADDDFFALGGHSLLATQAIARLERELDREIPLRQVFQTPTLAGLAAALEERVGDPRSKAEALPPRPAGSGPAPLSFAQERLWFLDLLDPGSAAYNVPSAQLLEGDLDLEVLERAFAEVRARHESLRTTFGGEADAAYQVIHPPAGFRLPVVDLGALPEEVRRAHLERLVEAEVRRPFDLGTGPLLRVVAIRADRRSHGLVVSVHHIVSDGWSMARLVGEMTALYNAFSLGEPSPLPELPIQYADYAVWQRAWLAGGELDRQLDYWSDRLAGVSVLELPTDRPRPAIETFRGAELPMSFDAALTDDLESLAQSRGVTVFMLLMTAYKALLARLSGQTDIAVGSPIAGRGRVEIEELVGFFANTLVLRTDLSGNPTFDALLDRVRETTLGAYAHQDLPFERLVEALSPERDLSHNPLFQVELVLQNQPRPATPVEGLSVTPLTADAGIAKFDLTVFLIRVGGRLEGLIEYNTDLFDRATVQRMSRQLEHLLRRLAATDSRVGEHRLDALPFLSERERHQILREWNAPPDRSLSGLLVHQIVAREAARTPEAVAVVHEHRHLSYAELERRSNRLAWRLVKLGIGPEAMVGVCVERSVEMAVTLLGVLKAGAAGLALDPAYPEDRLSYIIQEAGLSVLVVDEHLRPSLPDHDGIDLVPDREWRSLEGEPEHDPGIEVDAANPMYIIYTSGTTGLPKGIVVTHGAFANLLEWQLRQSGIGAGRTGRTVQFATFGFCVSFQEIFTSWCSGSTLVLASDMVRRDIDGLAGFVERFAVERLHLPFAALKHLAEAAANRDRLPISLTEVITAGEPLLVSPTVRGLFDRLGDTVLRNQYGASETHVVTSHSMTGGVAGWPAIPPVGRPITHVRIYLLDRHLRPVPSGVPGALYSSGLCEARGYLAEPRMTAEKYIPDAWSGVPGLRLYRTGDLARRLHGGEIDFLGRIDDQVKIRGYRLELGEVDTVLARHPEVRDVASLVRPTETGNLLVSYVVPETVLSEAGRAEAEARLSRELVTYMKAEVPEHMVPSAVVVLDVLPVNANGKLDREALPEPGSLAVSTSGGELETAMQETVAALWAGGARGRSAGAGRRLLRARRPLAPRHPPRRPTARRAEGGSSAHHPLRELAAPGAGSLARGARGRRGRRGDRAASARAGLPLGAACAVVRAAAGVARRGHAAGLLRLQPLDGGDGPRRPRRRGPEPRLRSGGRPARGAADALRRPARGTAAGGGGRATRAGPGGRPGGPGRGRRADVPAPAGRSGRLGAVRPRADAARPAAGPALRPGARGPHPRLPPHRLGRLVGRGLCPGDRSALPLRARSEPGRPRRAADSVRGLRRLAARVALG